MRIGLSVNTALPGSPAGAVETVLERVRAAAGAGLDHLSLGDHHSTGPTNYLQGVPMLGRAMAEWQRDRQAGLLFLLPLWHPVVVAEFVGTLAAFSDRPLIIQTGIGYGQRSFDAMGASMTTRGVTLEDSIGVIDRLLSGERVDGPRFGIAGAQIGPIPEHGVEWWIGAGPNERPLERAARLGDAWYASPGHAPDELAELIGRYRAHCVRHGRSARVVARRDVLVADDDAAARRRGDELVAAGYRQMSRETLVCGGVERVAETFAALGSLGVDDIAARTPSVGRAEAVRSIELLGEVRALL